MDEDRPRIVERVSADTTAGARRQNRSTGMVVLGVLLFVWAGIATTMNDGDMPAAAILLGLLGIGLVVGGLVIRR